MIDRGIGPATAGRPDGGESDGRRRGELRRRVRRNETSGAADETKEDGGGARAAEDVKASGEGATDAGGKSSAGRRGCPQSWSPGFS